MKYKDASINLTEIVTKIDNDIKNIILSDIGNGKIEIDFYDYFDDCDYDKAAFVANKMGTLYKNLGYTVFVDDTEFCLFIDNDD